MAEPGEVTVLLEDQQNINVFNRLNQRVHEIEAELAAIKTRQEDHEDAENELMLADEEDVRYVLGECFFHLSSTDEATERLTADGERLSADKERLDSELSAIKEQMASLKALLYGKFGNAINLEE